MNNPISNRIRAVVIAGWIIALVLLEVRRPLRRQRESKLVRDTRNFAVAAAAGIVMQAVELPVAFSLAQAAQAKRRGLLPHLPVPPAVKTVLGVLALDYTLYWWHFLTHRVPLLWRFHQVHHVDRDMDASTALRFHFGEIGISVLFRAAQMIAIGPTPWTVAAWQVFLFVCILFHHSNVRLPLRFERLLARVIVTPRLHGIHHSVAADEVNSNWSSGLTMWDWLHATLRTAVPQDGLTVGVAGHETEEDGHLGRILMVPFRGRASVPDYTGRPVRQSLRQLV